MTSYRKKNNPLVLVEKVVDKQTGEIQMEEVRDYDPERNYIGKKKPPRADHFRVYDRMVWLLLTRQVSWDEFAVLSLCTNFIEYDTNYVVHPREKNKEGKPTRLNIKDLSVLVGWNRNTLTKNLKSLSEKGHITLERDAKSYSIKVAFDLAYRGEERVRFEQMQKMAIKRIVKEEI